MKAQRLNEHKGRKSKEFKTQFQTINKQNKTGKKMKKLIALALVVLLGANFAYAQTPGSDNGEVGASATITLPYITLGTATDLAFGSFTISGNAATAEITLDPTQASPELSANNGTTLEDETGSVVRGVIPVEGLANASFTLTLELSTITLDNGDGDEITLDVTASTPGYNTGSLISTALLGGDGVTVTLDGTGDRNIYFGGTLKNLGLPNGNLKTGTFEGEFTVEVAYL